MGQLMTRPLTARWVPQPSTKLTLNLRLASDPPRSPAAHLLMMVLLQPLLTPNTLSWWFNLPTPLWSPSPPPDLSLELQTQGSRSRLGIPTQVSKKPRTPQGPMEAGSSFTESTKANGNEWAPHAGHCPRRPNPAYSTGLPKGL